MPHTLLFHPSHLFLQQYVFKKCLIKITLLSRENQILLLLSSAQGKMLCQVLELWS